MSGTPDSYEQPNRSVHGRTVVRAALHPWHHSVKLACWMQPHDGQNPYVARPLVMEQVQDPNAEIEHFMTLQLDMAQELMDELWRCGLRPTEGTGSAGAMAATQKHLDDMRKLVFARVSVEG